MHKSRPYWLARPTALRVGAFRRFAEEFRRKNIGLVQIANGVNQTKGGHAQIDRAWHNKHF